MFRRLAVLTRQPHRPGLPSAEQGYGGNTRSDGAFNYAAGALIAFRTNNYPVNALFGALPLTPYAADNRLRPLSPEFVEALSARYWKSWLRHIVTGVGHANIDRHRDFSVVRCHLRCRRNFQRQKPLAMGHIGFLFQLYCADRVSCAPQWQALGPRCCFKRSRWCPPLPSMWHGKPRGETPFAPTADYACHWRWLYKTGYPLRRDS